jgi:hypothetical protein
LSSYIKASFQIKSREISFISLKECHDIMDGRRVGRGPLQLDIGIVLSNVGGNSSQDRNQFHGLFSVFGIDFGLYIGPSYNPFQTIGPSIGIGLLIGYSGFLAAKVGIHFRRTFGLAMLIPIVPIYGTTGASFLATLPIPEGAKAVATIPLLLVPAAFVYLEDLKELCKHEIETLIKLRSYVLNKLKRIRALAFIPLTLSDTNLIASFMGLVVRLRHYFDKK